LAGCCECGDEPSGAGATELVFSPNEMNTLFYKRSVSVFKLLFQVTVLHPNKTRFTIVTTQFLCSSKYACKRVYIHYIRKCICVGKRVPNNHMYYSRVFSCIIIFKLHLIEILVF
jgi:hypothetical protein